jgi:hypothetical protein
MNLCDPRVLAKKVLSDELSSFLQHAEAEHRPLAAAADILTSLVTHVNEYIFVLWFSSFFYKHGTHSQTILMKAQVVIDILVSYSRRVLLLIAIWDIISAFGHLPRETLSGSKFKSPQRPPHVYLQTCRTVPGNSIVSTEEV